MESIYNCQSWGGFMKLKQFFLGLIALLATASVFAATTYTYTGPTYTTVSGAFTTSMRITGSFTTATPLVPNLAGVDITGQVTSYSFSDGVNTYTSSDANARIYQFTVATDANGMISWAGILLEVWENGTSPHVAGDNFSYMGTGEGDQAIDTLPCTVVGVSPYSAVADACIDATESSGLGSATVGALGSWTGGQIAATSIPTLSEWGMIILSSLLALGTILTLRRQHQ